MERSRRIRIVVAHREVLVLGKPQRIDEFVDNRVSTANRRHERLEKLERGETKTVGWDEVQGRLRFLWEARREPGL